MRLAHVHAHRVGGSARFRLERSQRCDGFFRGGIVVGAARAFGQQQRLGVRCDFMHRDAHVVDHADDDFDLLGVDHVVWQQIVDLGVGQIALFAALLDELLDLGLLLGFVNRHAAPDTLGVERTRQYTRCG